MRRLFVAGLVLLVTGCEGAGPKDAPPPPPDAALPDATPPDAAPVDLDALPPDAAPDAAAPDAASDAVAADADTTDAVAADAAPDVAVPDPLPTAPRTLTLSARPDFWIVYAHLGRLLAVRVALGSETGEAPRDLGPAPDGPLAGGRAYSDGAPWLFLPGDDGALVARDVARGTTVPLRLHGPVRVAASASQVLVVGRTGPAPDATIGFRVLEGRTLRLARDDVRGIALPDSVSVGLADWVLAFADGTCMALGPAGTGLSEKGAWRCGADPRAGLVGDGTDRLSFVGPHPADAPAPRLTAWRAVPGAVARPDGVRRDDPAEGAVGEVEISGALTEVRPPVSSPAGTVAWPVVDAEGPAIRVVGDDRSWRIAVPHLDDVLGVAGAFRELRAVLRTPEGGVAAPLGDPPEGPPPPVDGRTVSRCGEGGQVLPELCDDGAEAVDFDCSGDGEDGLCCGEPIRTRGQLVSPPPSDAGLWVDRSDDGYLYAYVVDGEARLVRQRAADLARHPAQVLVRWAVGALSLEHAARDGARIVLVVRTQPAAEGEAPGWRALWLEGLPPADESDVPCAPVLAVRLTGGQARFLCEDGVFDVPFGAAAPATPVPAPASGVRWVQPRALDRDDLYLVATGEAHALALWRDTGAGLEVAADVTLPDAVAALAPEARTLPIRLPRYGGTPARVRDGRLLEVLTRSAGWQPAPSTRWPVAAKIADYGDYALTLAEVAEPREPSTFVQVFIHDLSPGGHWWGRRVPTFQRPFTLRDSFHAFAPGTATTDRDGPSLFQLWGGAGDLTFEAYGVTCSASP